MNLSPTNNMSLVEGQRSLTAQVSTYAFIIVPFVAVIVAIPLCWGKGLTLLDAALAAIWYVVTMLGVTVGFHRYFTHKAFKANRLMRVTLAVVGSMAVEGPILNWVANHRRHHAFSDKPGDPHSPWLYGTTPRAIARGIWHSHVGWLLNPQLSNQQRFAPDLLGDPDLRLVHRLFIPLTIFSLLSPACLAWAITGSARSALTAFLWAGLVRVCLVHHVSWSVNSICHIIGDRPFKAHDRATNFAPLALLSMGEAWHNLHHADPTCARHGVDRGQIDIAARVIRLLELAGFIYDVRWPTQERLNKLRRT